MATNKISTKVRGLSFSEDGAYFVTVGTRHVRFWYLNTDQKKKQVPFFPFHPRGRDHDAFSPVKPRSSSSRKKWNSRRAHRSAFHGRRLRSRQRRFEHVLRHQNGTIDRIQFQARTSKTRRAQSVVGRLRSRDRDLRDMRLLGRSH